MDDGLAVRRLMGWVATNGYREVWVAGRGRVYEHRFVMETLLGRPLRRDEQVHHRNGDKLDNRPENLEVLAPVVHRSRHINPPRPCSNCSKPAKPLRRGRCNACAIHFRINGAERPEHLWDGLGGGNQWGSWRRKACGV